MDIARKEVIVRVAAIIFLLLTACLVRFDTETKVLFFSVAREATFKDLNALYVLVWIGFAAAVYNILQLLRCYIWPNLRKDERTSYRYLAWGIYLLDQAAVYVFFAANCAAAQASMLAVTGETSFQWMKLCNKYTRFCSQIGGSLLCGFFSTVCMSIVSSYSACSLFRLYSPNKFLQLKLK